MPFVLILAFAASFGLHVALLFGPDIELSNEVESAPLMAELRPMPRSLAPLATAAKPEPRQAVRKSKTAHPRVDKMASASPLLSVPDAASPIVPQNAAVPGLPGLPAPAPEAVPVPAAVPETIPEAAPAPAEARLPPRGMIRYRVDRGDSNFEIGVAQHEWSIVDGHYRLTSVAETTGLVWLFKSIRVEMESRGLITAAGLQPQTFAIRRNGQAARETASFDWQQMTVSVAGRRAQALDAGAQDLLSFNYQLGYLPHYEAGGALPIATGKKYAIYRLEVLGDETVDLPAGVMRTLHLRAPGTNSTDLWLAYDYLLLPVKIRYVDAQGDSFVQVATKIQVGDAVDETRDEKREQTLDGFQPR